MCSAGYSLTYFTIDSVFPLVVLSVGGSHGFGYIFVYAIAIGTTQKWFPDNIKGWDKMIKLIHDLKFLSSSGLMGSIVVPLGAVFFEASHWP